VGILVTVVGFFFINKLYTGEGHLSWALLQAAFLWMLLIFLIILTDSNETIKEELKEEIREHKKETKLLRDISEQQLKELQLLRKTLSAKKKR
jgi:Ca2+/Na+ antiporter